MATGKRVKVTESLADRAAPAVGTSAWFALVWPTVCCAMLMLYGYAGDPTKSANWGSLNATGCRGKTDASSLSQLG